MSVRLRLVWVSSLALLGGAVALLSAGADGPWSSDVLERTSERESAASPIDLAFAHAADEPALVGRPVDRPRAEVPGPADVTVTVIGPGERLLAGVPVDACWPRDAEIALCTRGQTDESGRCVLEGVPMDGSARVRAVCTPAAASGRWDVTAVVDRTSITLRTRFGLPLAVRPVDTETGWTHDGVGIQTRLIMAPQGVPFTPVYEVKAPKGWVAWAETTREVQVSTWATRLELVYPLRREADVRVLVLDHEGRPETRGRIAAFEVAGREVDTVEVDDLSSGRFRLHGVPFFRGERIRVGATSSRLVANHWAGARLPVHPADTAEVVVNLPPPEDEPLAGGSDTCSFRGRVSRRPFTWPDTAPCALRIRVLRRDGSRASHAAVRVDGDAHHLDARGELHFDDLEGGWHQVTTRAVGLLHIHRSVETTPGEETLLVLREPQGGAIDLRVVDPDGRPLSYASFEVGTQSRQAWIDETGGVQRIDPYVDHLGRRRLEHVEPGEVEIQANWASRKVKQKVEVREGEVTHLELVLRP